MGAVDVVFLPAPHKAGECQHPPLRPFFMRSAARGWHPEGYLPLIKKNQSINPTIITTMRVANKKNMIIVHDHTVLLLCLLEGS